MTTRIFVDATAIEWNREPRGINDPHGPIVVEQNGQRTMAFSVTIFGPSTVVYDEVHPRGNAVCWVETEAPVAIGNQPLPKGTRIP